MESIKHKVHIRVYDDVVELSPIIIYGDVLKPIAKVFEAIGFDPQMVLTLSEESEIEAFADHWALFFCNKFKPSSKFINDHLDWLFVSTDGRPSSVSGQQNHELFWLGGLYFNSPYLKGLADFTGISAIAGLDYNENEGIFVHIGKATVAKQHTTVDLGTRFAKEMVKWTAAGMPKRSPEIVQSLFDSFCNRCSEYIADKRKKSTGRCSLCGCGIKREDMGLLNKLVWGTTSCPADPPKWTADIAVNEEGIRGREKELYDKWLEVTKKEYPQTGEVCSCD